MRRPVLDSSDGENKSLKAELNRNQILDKYEEISRHYDFWARFIESRAHGRCLELAAIQDGESVLEVAVGTGLIFEQILKINPKGRNEGIDLSEAMLSRARQSAERSGTMNYRLSVGDAYNLAFLTDSFDVVINSYMFDLVPEEDFSAVLGEFKRILRPGGRLVVVSMAIGEHWYNSLWQGIYWMNPVWYGGCRGVYLLPYLESLGFEETKREFISQLTFPSEVVYGVKPKLGETPITDL